MSQDQIVVGTPKINRKIVRASPRTVSRRSLFREESDLSDVSPLSPSTEEEKSPTRRTSPRKRFNQEVSTPLKSVNNLSSLSLDSPIQVHSEGHAAKVRGVNALNNLSPNEISPRRFYGSQTEPRNPSKSWMRDSASKARAKLFLDHLPRDKKRGRTSSGQKVQPPPKRMKRNPNRPNRMIAFVPKLGQKFPIKRSKKRSPNKHGDMKRRRTESPEPADKENISRTPKSLRKVPKSTFKLDTEGDDVEFDARGWNILFTKPSRLDDSPVKSPYNPDKKFFKSTGSRKKMESKAGLLTPPSSSRKQRSLCRMDLLYMSPQKSPIKDGVQTRAQSKSPMKRSGSLSPRKKVLKNFVSEITKDIEEMLEDDPNLKSNMEITNLIKQLNQDENSVPVPEPGLETLQDALPSPLEDDEQNNSAANDNNSCSVENEKSAEQDKEKLYPIFDAAQNKKSLLLSNSKSPMSDSGSPKNKSVLMKKRSKLMGLGQNQYQIDSGQKGLVETSCNECGLFYTKGCPEDEILHDKFHLNLSTLSYSNWKKERVVGRKENDKVIRIQLGDPKSWWKRAHQIVSLVDEELGFPPISLDSIEDPTIYLYIKNDKLIAGCLVSERIHEGYKILTGGEECSVDQCSEETYPVRVGISRLWVHPSYRRSHVATSLINSLRGTYCYGAILRKEDMAISVPTEAGKKFFARYFGYNDYIVYL